jgi:hypothetical protein
MDSQVEECLEKCIGTMADRKYWTSPIEARARVLDSLIKIRHKIRPAFRYVNR